MELEIWKDVPEYENYQVSSFGRVKSLVNYHTKKEMILNPIKDVYGYYLINLYSNRKRKILKIHQLVAILFLNHNPNGYEIVVDHKDNNRLNNHVDNLQLISSRHNSSKDRFRYNYSSKYVGVSWHKRSNKWQSRIVINDKSKYLGLFENEIKAHEAYQKALSEL